MTSYLKCLQPLERVLPGTSRLNFCNFHSPCILDQIILFFFFLWQVSSVFNIYLKKYLFMYLAAQGLSCGLRDPHCVMYCSGWVQLLPRAMWDPSSPVRDQTHDPALQGRFSTTGPQGSPQTRSFSVMAAALCTLRCFTASLASSNLPSPTLPVVTTRSVFRPCQISMGTALSQVRATALDFIPVLNDCPYFQ